MNVPAVWFHTTRLIPTLVQRGMTVYSCLETLMLTRLLCIYLKHITTAAIPSFPFDYQTIFQVLSMITKAVHYNTVETEDERLVSS